MLPGQPTADVPPDPFGTEPLLADGGRYAADVALLDAARVAWDGLRDFRARRRRSRDYYRGRQWEETTTDDDGQPVTEREKIERAGRLPSVNNQVAPVIRHLKGQLGLNKSDPEPFPVGADDGQAALMMSAALRGVFTTNRADRLGVGQFEELLLSGAEVWQVSYRHLDGAGRADVALDAVSPDRFFFNDDAADVRLDGLHLCGELLDLPFERVVQDFAASPEDEQALRAIYGAGGRGDVWGWGRSGGGFHRADALAFDRPAVNGLCRVVAVWDLVWAWVWEVTDPTTGEMLTFDTEAEAEAHARGLTEFVRAEATARGIDPEAAAHVATPPEVAPDYRPRWRCSYLAPTGAVLWRGWTPYWHGGHPYAVGLAVRVDGETWGMVEDLIDSQRMHNRLNAAVDHLFGAGSKGPLIYDKRMAEAAGLSHEDVTDAWTRFDGSLGIDPSPLGPQADVSRFFQQAQAKQLPGWLFQWMEMHVERIRQGSGVQAAAMGAPPTSGTPASLYHAQVIQSSANVRDYFEAHFEVRREVARKALALIAQFYDAPRQLRLGAGAQVVPFDPGRVRALEWDIAVGDVADTVLGQQLLEDDLKGFLGARLVTFDEYLRLSSNPRAEAIRQVVAQRAAGQSGGEEEGKSGGGIQPPLDPSGAPAPSGPLPEPGPPL